MRLPTLPLAAVLLLSSLLFAQHSTPPSPPSPPPPPPAATPSPAPPPEPAHVEAPSAPSIPASAPTVTPSTPPIGNSSPASVLPAAHAPDANRIAPDQKIAGEARIEGAPRVGQDEKHADPDLRHRICDGKDCEKHPSKPAPSESDLRVRPCLKEPCPCPAGTTWSGHGCIASSQDKCPAGQIRSNGSCTTDECASLVARAASIAQQARDARARMEQVCSQDPYGQECADLKREHEALLQQYRALYFSVPINCRGQLPDPSTL
jgi:hypothetical protein